MKSPLRYPGGKTRACKILDEIITEHDFNVNSVVSPFFGVVHLSFIYVKSMVLN